MKTKGIIFSAPMVRALLDGRKTQTRRLLRNPEYFGCPTGDCPHMTQAECAAAMASLPARDANGYAPGDRLYVREAFGLNHYKYHLAPSAEFKVRPADLADEYLSYRATEDDCEIRNELRYRPSIHMPRWASRLWLEVTAVRVERLQSISEADAIAEGIDETATRHFGDPVSAYQALWNSLHGTDETCWQANPWIVAVTFNVHLGGFDA